MRTIAVAALLALVAVVPAAAAAASGPPSAVAEYVETLPGSGGATPVGTLGGQRSISGQLYEQILNHGGDQAAALIQIASDAQYGAPQTALRPERERSAAGFGGGGARLVLIGAIVAVITAFVLGWRIGPRARAR